MFIRPNTDSARHALGGDCYPNATNFPQLAHCWLFNSAEALGYCTDVTGGVVAGDASNIVNVMGADGTLDLGAAKNVIKSGILVAPPTTSAYPSGGIVVLSVGKPAASQGTGIIGAAAAFTSTAQAFRSPAAVAAATVMVSDSATAFTSGVVGLSGTGSLIQTRLTVFQYGGNCSMYDYDTSAGWTARTPFTMATVDMGGIDQAINLGGATSNPAMLQVWYFHTMPSDVRLKELALWTDAVIRYGVGGSVRKWIYPAMRNLAA